MKVRLLTDCEIECIDKFQDLDVMEPESFKKGEILEFDIVDHPSNAVTGEDYKNLLNVQFGDGSMAFGISTDWFEVIEE